MSRHRWSAAAGALVLTAAAGCTGAGGHPTPAAAPPVPVVVGEVVRRDVPVEWRGVGTVEPPESVEVRSRVGGTLVEVRFHEGDDVRRGDLLFVIDPRPYRAELAEAEAQLARARAVFENADQESRRYVDLVAKDYVTREQYESRVAAADAAKATVAASEAAVEQAKLQIDWCSLRSPLDGRTGSLLVHAGNLVKANDDGPLVVIHQVEPIRVRFAVPQAYLAEVVRRRSSGELRAEAAPRGEPLPARAGQITFVDNAVDPSTGTVLLKATFANADRGLWPGQLVDVVLTLTVEPDAVVAPARAIQTGQDGDYAFVVKPDRTVDMRAVVTGRPTADGVVVERGLAPGEQVVVEGQLRLTPDSTVALRGTQ